MLINIKEILSVANEHNFAVPAFNIGTGQMLKAVIECCEEKKAPVILALHPLELNFQGDSFMKSCVDIAKNTRIPVCIHLDHGSTPNDIYHAIRTGFTSVMMDGSLLSFEDNVKITKKVVEIAHPLGISVEGELGTIGTTGNDKEGGSNVIVYTNPNDAVKFVKETGIDCLAIAIGTAHGIYPKEFKPELKLDLLSEIKKKISVPIVLHGGSANPDAEISKSIKFGVNKINISSDIKDAFYQRLRKTLSDDPKIREPFELYVNALESMKQVICQKIDLFNDANKVQYYTL